MRQRGLFFFSFLVSAALHLAGVALSEYGRSPRPPERPPVLQAKAPRFLPVERFSSSLPDPIRRQMQRLAQVAAPQAVPDAALPLGASTRLDTLAGPRVEALSPTEPERAAGALPERFDAGDHARPFVNAGREDAEGEYALDLVDLPTLARAGKERAVLVRDPQGKRPPQGFIHFRHILLDGSSETMQLEALARYMRDRTAFAAYATGGTVRDFADDKLLRDPVHFFFPGPNRGRGTANDRIYMDETESELLGRYLRGGGFLLIDAGLDMDDQRFLRAAVGQVRRALGHEGRTFSLGLDHPVYRAYYDRSGGFPGENKRADDPPDTLSVGSAWFYPKRMGCGDIPRGLWGIEHGGRTVAIVSDLDLKRRWSGEPDPCAEEDEAGAEDDGEETPPPDESAGFTLPALQAGTNIVVYALMREGAPTRRLVPFAWQGGGSEAGGGEDTGRGVRGSGPARR